MASLSPAPRTTTPQRCSVAYCTLTACCGKEGSTRPAWYARNGGSGCVGLRCGEWGAEDSSARVLHAHSVLREGVAGLRVTVWRRACNRVLLHAAR